MAYFSKSVRPAATLGSFLALAACGGEPGVYSQSPDELRAIFAEAKTEYRDTKGGALQTIAGRGFAENKVKVEMWAEGADYTKRECALDFISVEGGSKAVAKCAYAPEFTAGGQTLNAMQEIAILEHVDATLAGRTFDPVAVRTRSAAAMQQNMKGMRQEALEAHDRQNWEAGDDARIQAWVDETVGAEMERIELEEAGW